MENTLKFTVSTTFSLKEKLVFSIHDKHDKLIGIMKTGDGLALVKIYGDIGLDEPDVNSTFDQPLELQRYFIENEYKLYRPQAEDCRWIEYQPNPQENKTNDCSIRAYCKAEGLTWDDAYDIAAEEGLHLSMMPNDKNVVDNILVERFKYTKRKLGRGDKLTVNEFALEHQFGTYIVLSNSHAVAIVDGFYYDSYDSGDTKISVYYEK